MKQKFILSALTLCLAACSGGGSGSSQPKTSISANPVAQPSSAQASSTQANANTSTGQIVSEPLYEAKATTPSETLVSDDGYLKVSKLNVAADTRYATPKIDTQLFVSEKTRFAVRPAAVRHSDDIQKVLELTNKYRVSQGLPALVIDNSLMAHAQKRAEEIVGHYDGYGHTRPDGSSFSTGLNGGGAENIAHSQRISEEAVEEWILSPSHRNNIEGASYTKIGIGMVYSASRGLHWVQIFGNENTTSNYYFDQTLSNRDDIENATAHIHHHDTKLNYLWLEDEFWIDIADVKPNGQWHSFAEGDYKGVINGYDNFRFGLVQQNNSKYQAYYQGNEISVSDMPTSGVATYKGKGVMTSGMDTKYLNAQFLADFGNKKLSGALSQDGKKVLDIQAHIEGKAFHSPTNATVDTEGEFFGTKAQELGGVFYDHSTKQYGAFGAKQ